MAAARPLAPAVCRTARRENGFGIVLPGLLIGI